MHLTSVTTYTYSMLSAVRTATETVGAATRTTTTGYAAGRPATAAVAISPAQPSRTALPDVAHGYDAADRVTDPGYGYDAFGATTTVPASDAGGAALSIGYDAADRVTDPGYGYDAFGATTTVPASDAGGAALSIGYDANDLVASQAQSGATKTWTLDPARRLRAATDSGTGRTATNHYGDAGDAPAWIAVSDGSWTRNLAGPDGELAAIASSTGNVDLQLTNLHGDVVATAANSTSATGIDAYFESTEFGVARADNPVSPRYGWLGAKERSSDALGGRFAQRSSALGKAADVWTGRRGFFNRNDYGRLGWGRKGTAGSGRNMFRIAIGSKRAPHHLYFHYHLMRGVEYT